MANSLLSFGQSLGGAVFVPICNTIFDSSLHERIPARAPAVDAAAVMAAGATAFRNVVSPPVGAAGRAAGLRRQH